MDDLQQELIPKFSHILLNLTTSCNLRCPYCYFKDYHYQNRNMSSETCKQVLQYCEFLGIKTLHLFGGEPCLNIKPLMPIIRDFAYKNPEVEILITTNGTLLDDKILSFMEELPYFTLSFTYLNREDVNNTPQITNVIKNTNLNYFITAVINKENISTVIKNLQELPRRKTSEFINLQPENPSFSPFEQDNILLFKKEVKPILPLLGVYNLYKENVSKNKIKDFLQIDSQLKVSPEGDFTVHSIYEKQHEGYLGHCEIEPDRLFEYLKRQYIITEGTLCKNCPLINNKQSHCYMNKPLFYKLLDGPNSFLCGWGQVLYEMINEV